MAYTRRKALLGTIVAAVLPSLAAPAPAEPAQRFGGRQRTPKPGGEGQRRADLGDGTYQNPVLAGDHPDPSILKDGATYLKVSSSFLYYPGLVVWRSLDLVNWEPIGPALRLPIGSVYAPDLVKHNGRYFIYMAVRSDPAMPTASGERHRIITNYVIYAQNIEGPWSEPVDIGIYNAIDPGHAVGEDSKRYLYLSDGKLVSLSDDGLSRVSSGQKLYDGWKYPADWVVETFALEGPKIVRRGDWFYLFSAQGGTAGPPTSHMVVVARSRSIKGPWENCPNNPIVRTRRPAEAWWSRGHATPIEDAAGRWWLVYHGYENGFRTLGRQMLLEPLEWPINGWPRALGSDLSKPLPKPAGPAGPAGAALSGPFEERLFGARMAFYRPAPNYMDRVAIDRGALILKAQGNSPADTSPLVLNPGDRSYELSIAVELTGPVTAGILLFYDENLFCGIASGPERLIGYALGKENGFFEPPVPAIGPQVHFKVVNADQVGRFYYSPDGQNWVLHHSYEVSGYNQNMAGGYLSLRPALFASGTGSIKARALRYQAL